jgi:hypothetical protein
MGLARLDDLAGERQKRRGIIRLYLDLLERKVTTDRDRSYVLDLRKHFADANPTAAGFVVTVEKPREIQLAARRLGFEVWIGNMIADLPDVGSPADYPCAFHLAKHAVKLPLLTHVPDHRIFDFADQITSFIAGRLRPFPLA